MANYQNQRGTYDAFDEEAISIDNIVSTLKEIVSLYGYNPIHTPIYEQTELFMRSAGESSDIVTKEMFTFLDKGNRSITLRPELTAGVIRAIVNNKLYATKDLPLKYYYYGPAFRYERPSKGRYRQFNQFGIECVGVNSFYNDVECIALGYSALKTLGFDDLVLKINTLGDEKSRLSYQEALKEYFKDKIDLMCNDCKRRYEQNVLRILDCKDSEDQEIIKNAPKMSDYLTDESKEYFNNVLSLLDEQQIPYQIDDTLVRGLDYYSHVVFEYHYTTKDGVSVGAVGAGGHYDNLVKEIGGPTCSSVGLAFGVERINTLLKDINNDDNKPYIDVFIIHIGEVALQTSFLLAQELRNNFIKTDLCLENKSISSQFKIATRKNASYAIIIGEDEVKTYVYPVKNLITGEQVNIEYQNICEYIENQLLDNILED